MFWHTAVKMHCSVTLVSPLIRAQSVQLLHIRETPLDRLFPSLVELFSPLATGFDEPTPGHRESYEELLSSPHQMIKKGKKKKKGKKGENCDIEDCSLTGSNTIPSSLISLIAPCSSSPFLNINFIGLPTCYWLSCSGGMY
jgi:hypothetical protein